MKDTLIIPDLHMPWEHPDALRFCIAAQKAYGTQQTIFLGDIVDLHSLSFHTHDPGLMSPGQEIEEAKRKLKRWLAAFPKAAVCRGNHDSLIERKAFEHGIPVQSLRSLGEIYATTGWTWHDELMLPCGRHHVVFRHSWGGNISLAMARSGVSVVAGHWHSKTSLTYGKTPFVNMFAMQLGCLIDDSLPAFQYNKRDLMRPILNVGIIQDGCPHILPMFTNDKGRWIGKVP